MSDLMSKVDAVNALLAQGEPGNISVDSYMGYMGYKPQAIIDAMNEVFGIGSWGFEELSSDVENGEKGALAVARVRAWLAGIDFKPSAWGQSNVTRGAVGDARKGAATDALKKALSYFSIGNRAYHGLLDQHKPAQRPQPMKAARPAPTTDAPEEAQGEPAPFAAVEECRREWSLAYSISNEQVLLRWPKYTVFALGRKYEDNELTAAHLARLNEDIARQKAVASTKKAS